MSDEKTTTFKNKSTVELYRDLVNVEMRSLVHRVTETSNTIEQIFNLFEDLAMRLEEGTMQIEQNRKRLEMAKDEIASLSKKVAAQHSEGLSILARVRKLEGRLKKLEEIAQLEPNPA